MKEIKSGIYKITNIVTSQVYIGKSKDIKRRKKSHFKCLNKNNHHNIHLQNSFNKYREKSFLFNVIEYVSDVDRLSEREIFWIEEYDSFNCGFNNTKGGEGTLGREVPLSLRNQIKEKMIGKNVGNKHSDETRKKISQASLKFHEKRRMIGYDYFQGTYTDETRNKMSERMNGSNNPFYGKIHDKETMERIVRKNKGRKPWNTGLKLCSPSEETRRKISESHKGKIVSVETRVKLREKKLGENGSNARLKEGDIYKIRGLLDEGFAQEKIASMFNVSRSMIYKIKYKKSWSHI